MTERRFFGMTAIAVWSAIMCFVGANSAAVFAALMVAVLGFDAICEVRK